MNSEQEASPVVEVPLVDKKTDESSPKKIGRSGGAYLPPQRAAMLAQALPEAGTEAYQRLHWEALRKSLNGLINKVNASNIKEIIVELFGENLVRGRGLLVRAVMKAQAAALPFTAIYSGMVAVLNTKLPQIGELLVIRLVHQFRRAYRRNDKMQCLATCTFLAHLVNQRVAHEIVALQLLTLLLERPTDDSVEIAVGFMRECGAALAAQSPRPTTAVFERFRAILHEGAGVDRRVQYMVEVLFQLRKDGFVGHEAIRGELDLVPEEEQITHYVSLDDELDVAEGLNVFHYDPEYLVTEEAYARIKEEILGEDEDEEEVVEQEVAEPTGQMIVDQTGTDLTNLRKTIYLTIMSSVDFEECGHKLLRLNIPSGLEFELPSMIIECCSQERTYLRFFGLLSERFCLLDPVWREAFEAGFADFYATVHRLETGKIRNVAKLFGHLLFSEALPWTVLSGIRLSEEATTSASRILIKFLFQELQELYGLPKLSARLEEAGPDATSNLLPTDDLRDCRFAINFFTAIGMGLLTEGLRAFLASQEEEEPVYKGPPQEIDYDGADSYASDRSPSRTPVRERYHSPERHRERERDRSRDRHREDYHEPREDVEDRSRSSYRSRYRSRDRDRHREEPSRDDRDDGRHPERRARSPSYRR